MLKNGNIKVRFKNNQDLQQILSLYQLIDDVEVNENNFASKAIICLLDEFKYSIEKRILENRENHGCNLKIPEAQCYACLSVRNLINTPDAYKNMLLNEFIGTIHKAII